MPEHKLEIGLDFISWINDLGNLLGYYVELELPIQKQREISPAVDIAWFKEENQKFPLFIFEVESTASSGMTYNPLKVFSKKNEQFEKPLFFFQIVLEGGQTSSRIEDLKNQFGNYNYRIYRKSTNEIYNFIVDILKQHRRLSQNLNIINFIQFMTDSKWVNNRINEISNHIMSLEFEKDSGNLLSSFVKLSSEKKRFIPLTVKLIKEIHTDFFSNQNRINYKTYLGINWCFPIHLGIIYAYSDDLYTKDKLTKQLKYWQEKNSYMSMIGPHFGLSKDYDYFLIWGSGGLFGLLSFLFSDNDMMKIYFAKELFKIINKTKLTNKIANLLWILHIIPISEEGEKLFKKAIKELKKIKSFSNEFYLSPPFLNVNKDWIEQFKVKQDPFPNYEQLMETQKEVINKNDRIQIAFQFLSNEFVSDKMVEKIIEK